MSWKGSYPPMRGCHDLSLLLNSLIGFWCENWVTSHQMQRHNDGITSSAGFYKVPFFVRVLSAKEQSHTSSINQGQFKFQCKSLTWKMEVNTNLFLRCFTLDSERAFTRLMRFNKFHLDNHKMFKNNQTEAAAITISVLHIIPQAHYIPFGHQIQLNQCMCTGF